VTILLSTLDESSITLTEAAEGLKLLHELRVDEKEYREKAASKFPLAKVFKKTQ